MTQKARLALYLTNAYLETEMDIMATPFGDSLVFRYKEETYELEFFGSKGGSILVTIEPRGKQSCRAGEVVRSDDPMSIPQRIEQVLNHLHRKEPTNV